MNRTATALTALIAAAAANACRADNLVYFEENGGAGGPRGFYTFDPSTGLSTLRTTVGGSDRFFGLEIQPSSGRIYATSVPEMPCHLWTVDVDTGVTTMIGPINNATIADIAFDPTTGVLYGMDRNAPFGLYTIDPTTGTPTFIANSSADARCGMVCSASGQLYGFSIDGVLATIDKTTGAATVVGGSPVPTSPVEDATFTPNGELYFTTFFAEIYRVDVATGQHTLVGNSGSGSGLLGIIAAPGTAHICYPNCDNSTIQPILNVNDFICFQTRFAAGDSYANCDGSTIPPVLNVNDFICFQTRFAAGCR